MLYIHASLQGLQALLTPATAVGLVAGIAWGLLISFMPGVGGNVALALLLPLMYRFSVPEGLAILFGAHIATYFGGSVTSITLNIPASAKSLPLCWDGYALASQGRGAYALRASASASGIGGVIGAVALTLGIPLMRGMLNFLGPPEILLLALLGAILIAILSSGNLVKGLMAFAIGIIASWVGQDPITGIDRLTFGSLYLSTGIQVADVAIGLFAIVQVLRLLTTPGTAAITAGRLRQRVAARQAATGEKLRKSLLQRAAGHGDSPLDGLWAVIRHWKLELYMAVFGVLTGTVPGFGAPVAAVAAYGQAAQFSKSATEFGTGAVEGVIAPQATDSAAEGGGMLPLLSLGIPTHEQQAILLAAFVTIGIAPGPTMLSDHLPTVFSIIWVIVIASLCMMVLGLMLARQFAKLTAIPTSLLVPLVMMISIVGAFAVNGTIDDVITTVIVGVAGYFFWMFNYSRINLIIGLVLGPIIESNLHITTTLYGDAFMFRRPLSAVIAVAIVITLAVWAWQNLRGRRVAPTADSRQAGVGGSARTVGWGEIRKHARSGQMMMAVLLLALFAAITVNSRGYGALTGGDLGLVALIGAVLAVANVCRTLMRGAEGELGVGERLRRTSMSRRAPRGAGRAAAAPAAASTAPAPSAASSASPGSATALAETAQVPDSGAGDDELTGQPAGSRPAVQALPSPRRITRALGIVVGFLVLTLLTGLIPATGLGFGLYTRFVARKSLRYSVLVTVLGGLATWSLFHFVVTEYAVYDGIWQSL